MAAPHLVEQWHPTKNGTLRPEDVSRGSQRKVWWLCQSAPDHVWQTCASNRVRGTGCPFCAGQRATLATSLAKLAPALAAQWHRKKNGALRPEDVTTQSGRKVWWVCDVARDHVWQARIANRARGVGCPFCAGQRACSTNSLATLAPKLAAQWHPSKNGALTPADITCGSTRFVWWKCPEGKSHEWRNRLYARTLLGTGCPFCVNHRKAAGFSARR